MGNAKQPLIKTGDIPVVAPAQGGAAKQMIAYQIAREMAHQQISRVEMAARMGTSRAQLNRLLDPDNPSVTLQSVEKAAAVLGLTLIIKIERTN